MGTKLDPSRGRGVSVRRACVLLGVARSAVGYPSCQAAKDTPLETAVCHGLSAAPLEGDPMTDTIPELDTVVLRHDVPNVGLRTGDIGAVVHRYRAGGYEVEFVTGGGRTVAVLTLTDEDVRSLAPSEILHARSLGPP